MRPRRRRLARLRRAGRPAPSASLRRLARAFARSRTVECFAGSDVWVSATADQILAGIAEVAEQVSQLKSAVTGTARLVFVSPSLFRLGGVDLPIHPGNVDPNTCGVLWLADMEPS